MVQSSGVQEGHGFNLCVAPSHNICGMSLNFRDGGSGIRGPKTHRGPEDKDKDEFLE